MHFSSELKVVSMEAQSHTKKINILSVKNLISNSLFLYLILKKKNKHINMVFECTIKKTQGNNYFQFIIMTVK